jgi:hypothetical protein
MHNSVVVTTIGDGYIRPKLTLLWIYALCIGCPAFVGAECSADYWRHADPAALVARTRLACGITMRPSVRLFVGLGSYGFAVFPFPERRKNENKSVFHCPSITRSIRPLDSTSKHKERREQERRARFAPPAAPVDLILFSAGELRLLEGHWVDGWGGEGGRGSCHLTEMAGRQSGGGQTGPGDDGPTDWQRVVPELEGEAAPRTRLLPRCSGIGWYWGCICLVRWS